MSRHPTTPMHEADVRRHLEKQTDKSVGLIDFLALTTGDARDALDRAMGKGNEIIALDIVNDACLVEAGRLIWENRGDRLFAIGSQGIEYALVAHWRAAELILETPPPQNARHVDRIAVVSGSCSPETAGQIAWAGEHGFVPIRVDATRAVDDRAWASEIAGATDAALETLSQGHDALIFTAAGPDDPSIPQFNTAIETACLPREQAAAQVGAGLGQILDNIMTRSGLHRCAIAGGDTSSYGAPALGIYALTALAPTVPGAALLKAHSDTPAYADLEIALKGGQMGTPDYFGQIKNGGRTDL